VYQLVEGLTLSVADTLYELRLVGAQLRLWEHVCLHKWTQKAISKAEGSAKTLAALEQHPL
jgi:hypothetical protein